MRAGYHVTVLTRDSARLEGRAFKARILQVDYDSDSSLVQALQGQDALVSTVAMSAIGNQERMIEAAIAAGVKYYVPAEYTVNSRDANAQAQPMMASVVAIQRYLSTKEDKINWFVINCGALLEFVLDHPVLLDFDNHAATLWDGGEGALSLSDFSVLARAVSAALHQPDRVADHRLRIHGGTITQNRALELAKRYSTHEWTTQSPDSQEAYSAAMQRLKGSSVADQGDLMLNMFTAYAAATFGRCDGHFESAYAEPDNEWLGVGLFVNNEIEEAIKRRVTVGTYAAQSATAGQEDLKDVSDGIAATFNKA